MSKAAPSGKAIDLHNDPVRSSFFKYLLPALSGMLIKSVFIMGDAWFIGRGVGAEGLGAVSLTIPFFSFFTAIAMMIGIGGAALMSIAFGKGEIRKGQELFVQSMTFTAILATILVTTSLFFLEEIISLMGAQGHMADLAYDYLSVMLKFFVIYALAWILSCFVRNDTNPKLAMYAMSAGAICNLVLDYLFIMQFGWGMTGAAVATGISQVLIGLVLLSHFLTNRGQLKLNLEGFGFTRVGEILKIGTPIFFIEVSTAVTIMLFNFMLLTRFGEGHVIAYGVTANVGVFALFTMVGIGQACQPIISFNYGAGNLERVREVLMLGLRYALGSGVVYIALILATANMISESFIADNAEVVKLAAISLSLYFMAAPLMGLNMIIANLFQATAQPGKATIISLGRGFVLVVAGMLVLPMAFPENGIWGSILFAEGITAVLSLIFLQRFLRSQGSNDQPSIPPMAAAA
ncbi:MATE family efflux transporter [Parendozoicomonas haliclonae]|uniref:Multidrug export protein MepA n=1 Tax=Parendozoicomonas haliclonae TaxID=1960125 RepID=A0A1X7AJ95_9GAMM|nr:MATE family efflux transporter [Parendozoicomonas haliclonae]SMA46296.1 Multidrug export protein MepA [Parendozoicomonas haliclonae]